jgi:hypothetical protein
MSKGHRDASGEPMLGKCCVCSADSSPLQCLVGPVSDFWCDECEAAPRLPYDYLARRIAYIHPPLPAPADRSCGWVMPLTPTLAFYKLTEDEFWALVEGYRQELAKMFGRGVA